jgi:antitoxin (DNA-binding transcriptional repressor) of toxin-antitoxin stability system
MKALELSEATGSLSEYARKARRETLVLTEHGKAVAAVVPLDEEDYFSMRLANNPEFIAIIERGRAQYKAHGGISIEEMRRKYDLESKPKRKTLRKAV